MTIRPNQKKNLILLKPVFVFFFKKASLILYILSDRIRLLPYENKLSDKEAVLTFVDDSVSIVPQGAQLSHLFLSERSNRPWPLTPQPPSADILRLNWVTSADSISDITALLSSLPQG